MLHFPLSIDMSYMVRVSFKSYFMLKCIILKFHLVVRLNELNQTCGYS